MGRAIVRDAGTFLFVILGAALIYPIGYMVRASFLDGNPSERIGDAALRQSVWVTVRFAAIA